MKQALFLVAIVVLLLFLGEFSIRMVEEQGWPLWKVTTLILAVSVLMAGVVFFLSYFLEKRSRAFGQIMWICRYILPFGGPKNALILGIIGTLSGILAIIKLLED